MSIRPLPINYLDYFKYVYNNDFNKLNINLDNILLNDNIYLEYIEDIYKNNYVWGSEIKFMESNFYCFLYLNYKIPNIEYDKFKLNLNLLHKKRILAENLQIGFKIENEYELSEKEKINIINKIYKLLNLYVKKHNETILIEINNEINNKFIIDLFKKYFLNYTRKITEKKAIYFIKKEFFIIKSLKEYARLYNINSN